MYTLLLIQYTTFNACAFLLLDHRMAVHAIAWLLYYFLLLVRTPDCVSIDANEFIRAGCLLHQTFKSSGDFIIAGFVPGHTISKTGKYGENYPSVIWASALAYAVEEINENPDILPGIKLGYDIRDSCNNAEVAITHSLEFILDKSFAASNGFNSIIAGVVGGASSTISTVISNLLSTDYVPQVSYSATSVALSDRKLYRSFFRTVPSDVNQAAAIADLLKYYDWTYVSVFASDDAYGRLGLDELRLSAKQRDLCFAKDKVFNPNLADGSRELTEIINSLRAFNGTAHVVVLWCQFNDAEAIIDGVKEAGISNITWIGTETWGTRITSMPLGHNLIGMHLYQPRIDKFIKKFYSPSSGHYNCRNPWYKNIVYGMCFLPLAKTLPINKYPQVVASVYSLAYGLHNTLGCTKRECPRDRNFLNYKFLYENITKLDFVIPDTDYRVKFNSDGESAIVAYDYMFLSNETYKLFGNWTSTNSIAISDSETIWKGQKKPVSHCSDDCQPGYYRIKSSSACCWKCALCSGNRISNTINQDICELCSYKEKANANHTECVPLKELRLSIKSQMGIFIAVASLLCVLLTAFVICVFIKYWDTPMVKASSREMSCVQLTSILLLFCVPIMYFVELSIPICVCRTLFFGFFFCTVVSIIVIKTYRLLRVFSERFTPVSRFLHNKYQILFSYVLVLVQVVGTILWNTHYPPQLTDIIDYEEMTYFPTCGPRQTYLFWITAGYTFILAVTSFYMAFRARKLPENFNETQFISFAMFTACVIWLCFVPLFVSLKGVDMIAAFLSINLLSTLSILFILYGYKIRIILFLPRLNSPEHFRNTSAAATVTNFVKDVKKADGTTRIRYQSVVTFEMDRTDWPSSPLPRRLTTTSLDTTSREFEVETPAPRRASFGGIEEKRHHAPEVSVDVFHHDEFDMKKYVSTPLLTEEGAIAPLRRPASALLNKMMSATSINRLFAEKNKKLELKELLGPETDL